MEKILSVYPTVGNTGLFLSSFFVLLFPLRVSLTFYWLILHGANRLNMLLPPLRRCLQRPPRIAIGTLNIWYGRGFRLAQAIWSLKYVFFDVMILT